MNLQLIIITSLKILFVWAAMRPGMVLYPIRWLLDSILYYLPVKLMLYMRKPLYECLFCMSSVWGFVFTYSYATVSFQYIATLMAIGGLNYLIELLIPEEK